MPDQLISQSLPSLINGVSRQPSSRRLPTQGQEQINFISDVALGLIRKPPAEHNFQTTVTPLLTAPADGVFGHIIERGDGKRFIAFFTNADVNVYDLDTGARITIVDDAAGPGGVWDYLTFTGSSTVNAKNTFSAVTVADFTFIVNRRKTVAMSGVASAARPNPHEMFLFSKTITSTIAQTDLGIVIDGNGVGVGGVSTTTKLMMDGICNILSGDIDPTDRPGVGVAGNWNFTRVNLNLVHGWQARNLSSLETFTVNDSFGDSTFEFVVTNVDGNAGGISKFSDLPNEGPDGYVVRVQGDEGTTDDEFYVAYLAAEGVWKETVRPGLDDNFDVDTMPHALVYDAATNTFTFQTIAWDARAVGDLDSAPEPSFVGKQIKDISVNKNRLHVIADENVIASQSGSFFNFWPVSATVLSDSDPFDIAGTGDRVSIWDYMIPFRGNLSLFSATGDMIAEVVGGSDEPTTIKNARVEERGAYALSAVAPVAADDTVFFLLDQGGGTSVSQYIQSDIDVFQADEISAHVSNFIPPNVIQMSVGRAENIVSFITSDFLDRLYIYRYHTLGDQQVMASWSYWQFETGTIVHHAEWIESIMHVFLERADGTMHMEKIDFGKVDEDDGAFTDNLGYRVYLDSLIDVAGTYDLPTDRTTWTIPYDQASIGGTYVIVRGGAWGDDRGSVIAIEDDTVDGTITALGDHTAFNVYIGREFLSTYEFSQFVLRGGTGETAKGARISGRLQLRRGRIAYSDTGTFDVEVTSTEDDDVYGETFTSQFINQAVYGATGLDDGVFDFTIGGDSRNVRVTLKARTFLPAGFASLDWEARYFQRSSQA